MSTDNDAAAPAAHAGSDGPCERQIPDTREPWPQRPDPEDVEEAKRIRIRAREYWRSFTICRDIEVTGAALELDLTKLDNWMPGAIARTPEIEIQIIA